MKLIGYVLKAYGVTHNFSSRELANKWIELHNYDKKDCRIIKTDLLHDTLCEAQLAEREATK